MRVRSFAAVVAAAAVVAVTAAGCADDGPDTAGKIVAAGSDAAAGDVLQPGATVTFVASEFMFEPAEIVAEPGTYNGVLVNDGTIAHDIAFDGGEPIVAVPGETVEFTFVVGDDGVTYICSIPGHADAGMVGRIETPTSADSGSGGSHAGGHAATAEPAVAANPDAAPYVLRDPRAPQRGEGEFVNLVSGGAADGSDLLEVELTIEEKVMTIADGYEQLVWTFNGEYPGPTLRAHVGDTIRVRLVNPPDATVDHSIDFHASQVAMNDEMRSIAPGEELIYEFKAEYAGVWMYHCGTAPTLHHISNGMFGMVIVEPAGGLDPVDNEFFFVQSEWYLGEQGEVSSYSKAKAAQPEPDFVMFNGVASQYADHPIQIPTGEDIRLFVLDAGPSIDSSFHVVGTIFHTVIKEGVHLVAGNDGSWGAQAVDLSPAQGAVIETRAAEDGMYAFVTHAFNFAERGAVGVFQAGDGQP